ncbi:MAG: lactoylglutathione lyase [Gammaproteobacteria bacterium]|nr:MAG: lactoylglutathione lyase [Gammaproteobacteria bacterium]
MKYLHTMVRVTDIEKSLEFYCDKLGLTEVRRRESEKGRFPFGFFSGASWNEEAQVELTYNWDPESYTGGRNFGHLAYEVDNIYASCQRLMDGGVVINRPPRDGRMAFVRSPDGISVELLQAGEALESSEPWSSREKILVSGSGCYRFARCLSMTSWCEEKKYLCPIVQMLST